MARVNVYLPDDLAAAAKAAGLNVSNVTQDALRRRLAAAAVGTWLDQVADLPALEIEHASVAAAVTGAKDEMEADG